MLRELTPQVVGIVARRYRDFAAAEDAVQEALLAATQTWPESGTPEHPKAWLVAVAQRRMIDRVRADSARRAREEIDFAPAEAQDLHDDSLALLFTCCHPALTDSSAIALTLRAVGGLTTLEIARAFMVPEATMAQRISRAKATIAESPFEPSIDRLPAVMHVIYLVFNEGYTTIDRVDLAQEAIRLGRLLHKLLPDDPEVAGLLALMLLTDARRAARSRGDELIPLDDQDRSLWNRDQIAEGSALIERVFGPGVYRIQAAIAALHDDAASFDATDWPQILSLYDALAAIAPNPMVDLNRAIALAMVEGPDAGLVALDAHAMKDNHRWIAARGHLLERAGDPAGARAHYKRAATRTPSMVERDYLLKKAASTTG
ncbi:MAG: sigma-70 family RNA polymerase sigma factor [Kofleriaceae bacterium]